MKLGAVIVTYNRIKLLRECLGRVLSQSVHIDRVIVIDNNSTDGTREYLDSIEDDSLTVYHEKENLGGAGGFYEALKYASQEELDYVLIIDDDAMIERSFMEKIVDFAVKNPGYEAYAGAVYTDGVIDTYHRRRLASKLIFYERMLDVRLYDRPREIDFATFCGLVIRGRELRRIGLPLKEYFIWYDDTEYCLRIKGKVALLPSAKLNHKTVLTYNNESLLGRISWKHYYGYRNRYDCAKRHLGYPTCVVIILEYIVFYIGSVIMYLRPDRRTQASYNLKMLRRVIIDCITGKLGLSEEYRA